MKKRNILPLGEPYIKTYSKYASLTSVISLEADTKLWLYFQFLKPLYMRSVTQDVYWFELRSADKKTIWDFEWDLCPFIQSRHIMNNEIEKDGFVDFAINCIEEGSYIYLDIDSQYIAAYKKHYYLHDIFLIGYDEVRNAFLCSDYFNYKYEKKWISFEEINNAFEGKRIKERNYFRQDFNFLWSLERGNNYKQYSREDFKRKLLEIINPTIIHSVKPKRNCVSDFYSGLDAYKYLEVDLREGRLSYADVRLFSVIKEHVILLNGILNDYSLKIDLYANKLEEISEILLKLSIKYGISKQENLKIKISTYINKIVDIEEEYINIVAQNM